MTSCAFIDFIQVLKPWLNDNYIKQAQITAEGKFTILFVDGGQQEYQVTDCSASDLEEAIQLLSSNGVHITKESC
jgi:beta-lactam-binding protein with PASTA domain